MQDNTAYKLDIEGTLSQGTLGGLTHSGEGFGQELVQRSTSLVAPLELRRLGAKLIIAEPFKLRLELVYLLYRWLKSFQFFLVGVK